VRNRRYEIIETVSSGNFIVLPYSSLGLNQLNPLWDLKPRRTYCVLVQDLGIRANLRGSPHIRLP